MHEHLAKFLSIRSWKFAVAPACPALSKTHLAPKTDFVDYLYIVINLIVEARDYIKQDNLTNFKYLKFMKDRVIRNIWLSQINSADIFQSEKKELSQTSLTDLFFSYQTVAVISN
jgi:hypothetical protein